MLPKPPLCADKRHRPTPSTRRSKGEAARRATMFGSTIKSEGDHDRFRSKADRVNVMTRMTREERMAKVDEKNGVSPKDSDDDLDSDWSDSSDDDSSDDYTRLGPGRLAERE